MRHRVFLSLAAVLSTGVLLAVAPLVQVAEAGSHAKPSRTPTPTPTTVPTPTPTPSSSGTFVKIYSNIVNGTQAGLTPEEVQQTSDGGFIMLGLTQAPSNGVGVSWLVKTDSSGNPQWQEELGCFGTPPGAYTDGVSAQQTSDGGYIVAGGTIGCGSGTNCPSASGIQCALVEKLDSTGKVSWAQVFNAGPDGSGITQIEQTSDGGYVAVGNAIDASHNTGALFLKLDGQGTVQWQRQLGPTGSANAYLNAVQQTSDGGYVATGELYFLTPGVPPTSALAIKLDSSGNVQWQQAFNNLDSSGSPTSPEHAKAIIQTADGGYLVGGNWTDSAFPGQCCAGALLLKLQSNGTLQWQHAYSGGVYCFDNGFNTTCTDISALIYALHQSSDGGYLLAGSGDLELNDEVPSVPWMAKVDSAGDLVWQHFYYESNPSTSRPLSEYFASSALTTGGGVLALGWTEDPTTLLGDLLGVKTDSSGLVGTCSDVKAATPLSVINPGLATFPPALNVQSIVSASGPSSSTILATSIKALARC